ncbi:MAG TPA: GTPase [Vicinamibacterales bacterium]|nr:GTPase [Vicinamibacterales bacterium]
MKVNAEFVTSATSPAGFPKDGLPELALAGRSNVGKSSLINALVRRKVAHTSAAPGKTRLANFYRVAPESVPLFYLVDLPGYGYARGGDASAREFETITTAYFDRGARRQASTGFSSGADREGRGTDSVAGILLLVDSRHPGLESDLRAWEWIGSLSRPRGLVATKIDKLSRSERTRHLRELERLHATPALGVSAQTGEGLKELWELIATWLRPSPPKKPSSKPAPPSRQRSI